MPSLLALLQHPVEDRRAYAADHASILAAASDVVTSALLSSSNGLSTLLTRLSGDDTTQSRSFYARLIALCIPECNAAALKKISDSGAVPYLLQLLREADGWRQQADAVTCLQARFDVPCCARCRAFAHASCKLTQMCAARSWMGMAVCKQNQFTSVLIAVACQDYGLLTVLTLLQSWWNHCTTCRCITRHCMTLITFHCTTRHCIMRAAGRRTCMICPYCLLQNLADTSKEIVTSIVIHGGTQQLLDLVHAGVQKVTLIWQYNTMHGKLDIV